MTENKKPKKKMGRPRKNPEGRDFKATIYLEKPVKEDLYDMARIAGTTASDLIHDLIEKEADQHREEINMLRRMRDGDLPPLIF